MAAHTVVRLAFIINNIISASNDDSGMMFLSRKIQYEAKSFIASWLQLRNG